MILGAVGKKCEQHFTVVDQNNNFVPGIDTTSFIVNLFDPSGVEVSGTIPVTILELSNGSYRADYTPNGPGIWYMNVYHLTYFPWGKTDDIVVYEADLTDIYQTVIRNLGLSHSNMLIDDTIYDEHGNLISARVRIYSDAASVGTNNNVIDTYRIEADGTQCGQFSYWKQVVI